MRMSIGTANPKAPWVGPTKRGDMLGLAGALFCLDFSCFVLCIKAKNEVGFRGKAPDV